MLKLREDLLAVDERNLFVGQSHFAHIILAVRLVAAHSLQITCHQQEAVNRGRIILNLRINDASVDVRNEGFALHQQLQTLHNIRRCRSQHLADDVIASRRLPERFGTAVIIEISNNRPGIKNLGIAEKVAIIPIAELLIFIRSMIVVRHLMYFT